MLQLEKSVNSWLDIFRQSDYNRQYENEKAMNMLKYLITQQREDVTG